MSASSPTFTSDANTLSFCFCVEMFVVFYFKRMNLTFDFFGLGDNMTERSTQVPKVLEILGQM